MSNTTNKSINHPKIVLIHDYIKEYGGAERVLETLHEMYPEAPVYTLLYAPEFLGPHKERFKNWDIKPSFIQNIPFSYKLISILRIFAPFIFKSFDLSSYDLVIVSATGAYSPNMIRTKGKHICYCHTPPRYLYGYATAREQSRNPFIKGLVFLMCHILRMVDYASSKNVDIFIANSHNVARRIKKFYRRESIVIYPPVTLASRVQRLGSSLRITNTKRYTLDAKRSSYFLAGGRLARPKHIDLIVKACTKLRVPLKVFGKGFAGYEKELQSVVSNVEFLGEVTDEEKLTLMTHAKAFIFAAEDEDFGIVPVEAMSVGTPVIAYKSGGVLETVVDPSTGLRLRGSDSRSSGSPTGVFFDALTVESLTAAIKSFEKMNIKPEDCRKQSEKFSKERFIEQIQKLLSKF